VTRTRFVTTDPEEAPASELLAEMSDELNALYWTTSRLTRPALSSAELRPPRGHGGDPVRVRVAEYTIDDEHGDPSEVFCLVTNLLDPAEASVEELAGLYADRWASETVFRCIKTTQRGGAEVVLRSKKPDGVLQEIWAILAVYQGLRHLICQAAAAAGAGPWRIPFAMTLRTARRPAHGQAAFSP